MNNHSSVTTGTIGGTLSTMLGFINSADFLKAALMSATGAVISFFISLLLKRLTKSKNL